MIGLRYPFGTEAVPTVIRYSKRRRHEFMCTSTCRKWKRMTMEQNNDSSSFQRFLTEFCDKLKDRTEDSDVVPIRFANSRVTLEELEGECLEWCLHFLSTRNCPVILAAALAHETYLRVSSCNLDDTLNEYTNGKESSNHESLENDKEEEKDEEAEDKVQEYNAEHLHKFVIGTLETVCKIWAEDVPPITLPNKLLEMSFQAIKNTRRKMEDSHTFVHDFNTQFGLKNQPQQSFYAVFDGHAGMDAAVFASKHLHCLLAHKSGLESDPGEALKLSFKLTDEAFIRKAKREKWRSGTTGVAALVRGSQLHIAWLGDSQGVLVRDGQAVTTMEPHKPDRQDERDRIEAQGGFVMLVGDLWRVGGNIAVSRAIGDVSYKPFICSDAEVISTNLDGTEDFLVLACDGVWDVVMPEDLPRLVYNHLLETNFDRSTVANMLVQHAKTNGSTDNISVIVVFFRENISEPKSVNLFNFGGFAQGDGENGMGQDDNDCDGAEQDKRGSRNGERENNSELQRRSRTMNGGNGEVMDGEVNDIDDDFNDIQGPSKNNEVDLDYYGLLDGRLEQVPSDLSACNIPNSSELLKNVAVLMHSNTYEPRAPFQDFTDEDTQQQYYYPYLPKPKGVLANQKKTYKRAKQETEPAKRYNKKGLATSPICWAFTGKNKASVQNHRLNQAAKTFNKGSLSLSDLKLSTKTSLEKNPKLTRSWPSNPVNENQEQGNSTGNVFISQGKYGESISAPVSTRNTSTTTIGQPSLTVFGSKTNMQVESKKFHTSWRPRKPLKPISLVVYDAPPTPFMNNKLHGAR